MERIIKPASGIRHPLTSEQGFALILVIVVMLLATFLASQLILQVRTELKIAYNGKARAAGLYLAEAGINLSLFRLMDKPIDYEDERYDIFNQGYMYEDRLADGRIRYYAVNESGKIDLSDLLLLNRRRLFELFFEYQGLEPDQIDTVIDSLLDWQDPDTLHRLQGAEKDFYETLEPPYVPRDKPIMEPAEFFLVNGTEALAGKFAPEEIFTVYNKTRKINFNSLTPAMLDFLVEGDEEKKAAYVEAQELFGILNAGNARDILGDERFGELSPFLTYSAANNPYYFIVSEGKTGYDPGSEDDKEKNTPGTKLSVLVYVQKNQYQYLSWQEDRT